MHTALSPTAATVSTALDWAWALKVEAHRRAVPMPFAARVGGYALHGEPEQVIGLLGATALLCPIRRVGFAFEATLASMAGVMHGVVGVTMPARRPMGVEAIEIAEAPEGIVRASAMTLEPTALGAQWAELHELIGVPKGQHPLAVILPLLAAMAGVEVYR